MRGSGRPELPRDRYDPCMTYIYTSAPKLSLAPAVIILDSLLRHGNAATLFSKVGLADRLEGPDEDESHTAANSICASDGCKKMRRIRKQN